MSDGSDGWAEVAVIGVIVLVLAVYYAIGFVVIHFVVKFW